MSPTTLEEPLGEIGIVQNFVKPSWSKRSISWDYNRFYEKNLQQLTILELPHEDVLDGIKRLNNSLNGLRLALAIYHPCSTEIVAHLEIEPCAREFCEKQGINVYEVYRLVIQSFSGLQSLKVLYSEDPEIHNYEKVCFHLIISDTTKNILSNEKEFRKRLRSLFPDPSEHLVLTYHIVDESP